MKCPGAPAHPASTGTQVPVPVAPVGPPLRYTRELRILYSIANQNQSVKYCQRGSSSVIRKNRTGGPGATQDRHKNKRGRTERETAKTTGEQRQRKSRNRLGGEPRGTTPGNTNSGRAKTDQAGNRYGSPTATKQKQHEERSGRRKDTKAKTDQTEPQKRKADRTKPQKRKTSKISNVMWYILNIIII